MPAPPCRCSSYILPPDSNLECMIQEENIARDASASQLASRELCELADHRDGINRHSSAHSKCFSVAAVDGAQSLPPSSTSRTAARASMKKREKKTDI